MYKTKLKIINEFANYFRNISYRNCYVGITSDIDKRLFVNHNVSKQNDMWIYSTASSDTIAREIETYFINAGMDGGSGGGDRNSNIVYAYRKTTQTNP